MEIDDDGDGDGDEDDDDSDSYDNDDDYLDPIDDNGDDLFPGQEFSTLIAGPYNEERADEALQVAISHRTLDNMITLKNSFAGHEQVLEYLHTHASSPALSSRDRLISVAMDHLYESSQDSIMHLEKSANADRALANKRHSDVSACMKELLHRFSKVEIASGLPIMPSHEDNFSPPVRASGAVDPVHLADPTDLAARVSKLDSELKLVKRRADSWEQTAKDQGKELTRMKAKLAASDKKWEEMDAKLRKTVDINNLFAGFFTGKVSPEQVCYPFHPTFLFCLGLSPTLPMPHPVEPRPFGSDRDLVAFGACLLQPI